MRHIEDAVHLTTITLKNAVDVVNSGIGIIKENKIRQTIVEALIDTGAATLVINEELCQILGLCIKEERKARVADGQWVFCQIIEPVEVHWKDRLNGYKSKFLNNFI